MMNTTTVKLPDGREFKIPTPDEVAKMWDRAIDGTISKASLIEKLKSFKAIGSFISLKGETEAQASKAKAATRVIKHAFISALLNINYANAVNNMEKREGSEKRYDEIRKPRTWGHHVIDEGHCLIEHKGKFYVQATGVKNANVPSHLQPMKSLVPARFFVDGVEKKKVEVEHLLKAPSKKPSTQQHLKGEVIVRDYSLDNVREICFQGKRLRVV